MLNNFLKHYYDKKLSNPIPSDAGKEKSQSKGKAQKFRTKMEPELISPKTRGMIKKRRSLSKEKKDFFLVSGGSPGRPVKSKIFVEICFGDIRVTSFFWNYVIYVYGYYFRGKWRGERGTKMRLSVCLSILLQLAQVSWDCFTAWARLHVI